MLNATAMSAILSDVLLGSTLFVSYEAGRPASEKAVDEACRAKSEGLSMLHHVGTFVSLKTSKKGDLILTVWSETRGEKGAYRAFNPNLGNLRSLHVIEHAADLGAGI